MDSVSLIYQNLNGGANTITEFRKTQNRSAKYKIQASAETEHMFSDVYVMHDDKIVYIRQVDQIYTIDPFVTYTATIDKNNVYLKATTTLANTNLVVSGELLRHPVTSSDPNMSLESVLAVSSAMSALYPDDNTDHLASMTSSLDLQNEKYKLYRKMTDGFDYMKTAEFAAMDSTFRAKYANDLANTINSASSTMKSTLQKDRENFYAASKKLDAITAVSGINNAYHTNPKSQSLLKRLLSKAAIEVLEANQHKQ